MSKLETVVFTNGVFDLLHLGHIRFLESAKSLGTKLIVGINSDRSAEKIKRKPVYDEYARQVMLESLSCVDGVLIFDEETPFELVKRISPHIICKGSDYKSDTVVGAEFANMVVIIKSYKPNVYKTGKIIDKIINEYPHH